MIDFLPPIDYSKNVAIFMKRNNFPKRFWKVRKTDWVGKLPEVNIEKNRGYFLTGERGTGKTMFACILGSEIFSKTQTIRWDVGRESEGSEKRPLYTCAFESVPEFLLEIQETFRSDDSADNIISNYSALDFLVLDDLGAEKASDWAIQMLYVLIDRREREGNNRIIITSNLSLDEIAERLSDRIASRIRGMCRIIKFTGKDRRLSGGYNAGKRIQ